MAFQQHKLKNFVPLEYILHVHVQYNIKSLIINFILDHTKY